MLPSIPFLWPDEKWPRARRAFEPQARLTKMRQALSRLRIQLCGSLRKSAGQRTLEIWLAKARRPQSLCCDAPEAWRFLLPVFVTHYNGNPEFSPGLKFPLGNSPHDAHNVLG